MLDERVDERTAHSVAGDDHRVHALRLEDVPDALGAEPPDEDEGAAEEPLAEGRDLACAVHQRRDHAEDQRRRAGRGLFGAVVLVRGALTKLPHVDPLREAEEDVSLRHMTPFGIPVVPPV